MSEKKVVLTLMRVYKKTVTVDVSDSRFDGLTDEEIQDILIEEGLRDDEEVVGELFANASLEEFDNVEGDRYDIYKDGEQTFGGHL